MLRSGSPAALDRPILTYEQIYAKERQGLADPYEPCLVETKEFLKLFARVYGVKIPRRTLQLYSSPSFKLLPLPVHRGGYKSYYLNPEHTVRLAVIVHLQKKHYFPLNAIQKVINNFPEEHYRFILKDNLTGSEILDTALLMKDGYSMKDILFRKVSRVLESIEEPYWKSFEKLGNGAEEAHEQFVDEALMKEARSYIDWLKAGHRQKIELAEMARPGAEFSEVLGMMRAIERGSSRRK
ncbi:MAG TPA: hypothetical protein VNH15_07210 [Elusimicrobiota bacterium]|nr:hypothetical protein [Elusimicrobiota bacterium]